MKNIANADRPKSVGAMLPPRPFLGSGKVAQTACNSDRREGKSCIPTVNQTFADSRILKISKFRTFRIAGSGLADFPRTGLREQPPPRAAKVPRQRAGEESENKRRANRGRRDSVETRRMSQAPAPSPLVDFRRQG